MRRLSRLFGSRRRETPRNISREKTLDFLLRDHKWEHAPGERGRKETAKIFDRENSVIGRVPCVNHKNDVKADPIRIRLPLNLSQRRTFYPVRQSPETRLQKQPFSDRRKKHTSRWEIPNVLGQSWVGSTNFRGKLMNQIECFNNLHIVMCICSQPTHESNYHKEGEKDTKSLGFRIPRR